MPNENTITQKQINDLFEDSYITEDVRFNKCVVLTCQLQNGFIIVESSACVDAANFDIEIGRKICIERIKNKLWELEGYKLQSKLYEEGVNNV
jgi:hypothetical protein